MSPWLMFPGELISSFCLPGCLTSHIPIRHERIYMCLTTPLWYTNQDNEL